MSTRYTASCDECGYTATSRTQNLAYYGLRRHSCDRQRMLAAREARVAARKAKDGPKIDCHCPKTRHEHGTRNAYVVDKCR